MHIKVPSVTSIEQVLHELFRQYGMEGQVEIQIFSTKDSFGTKKVVRVSGPFKTAEEFVDEAWEQNR